MEKDKIKTFIKSKAKFMNEKNYNKLIIELNSYNIDELRHIQKGLKVNK